MEHAGISNATARAEMAGSRQFGQRKALVQFLTIGEMLAAIGEPDGRRVSLLKLDVEGYEFAEGLLEQVVAQSAHSVSTTPRGLDPAPAVLARLDGRSGWLTWRCLLSGSCRIPLH